MSGLRKRRADDMLEMRYVVGVVFGSFLLLPFLAVLYPMFLTDFTDWGALSQFDDAFTGFSGPMYMPLFLVMTAAILYLTGGPLLRGRVREPETPTADDGPARGADDLQRVRLQRRRLRTRAQRPLLRSDDRRRLHRDGRDLLRGDGQTPRDDRLTDLTVSQVDTARLYASDGSTTELPSPTSSPAIGCRPRGERVPVDGTLAEGECAVDEAVVTGESLPVTKREGDDVVGGSVVTTDAAVVDIGERTTSSIDRLTRIVWNVQSADHGVTRRGDELAATVVPIVLRRSRRRRCGSS